MKSKAPVGAGKQGASGSQGLVPGYSYYEDDSGYSKTEATSLVGRHADEYDDLDQRKPFGWNAGTDLGLLILRLALGALFLAHGSQKMFGVLGGPGPQGFAQTLDKLGYQQSATLSLVTGGTELASGSLLVLGLFTPLAAAGIVGLMANVIFLNLGSGFFADKGGFELEAVIGVAALGLMFTGPGRVAIDNGRSWFRHPLASGFIGLLLAGGAAAAVILVFHR